MNRPEVIMNRRTEMVDKISRLLYCKGKNIDKACQITRTRKRKLASDILDVIKDGGGWP